MRKRAQRKSKPDIVKPKHIEQKKPEVIEKKPKITKNAWVAITLIGIFFLVLFFNSFFNISSGVAINDNNDGFEKYFLSGPDPYYNLRLVKETYETGEYPFYSEKDPLLNYPLGRTGLRAPLFVMSSFGFGKLLTPFMDEVDALGVSMQFIPALFGALLVFPVYFIGKTLFNKKAGLIAAFVLAIIPVHIGSGHGSAYSLFDHDSFNLLMFFLTFLFLIISIKTKDSKKSILYALIGGIPLAGLSMVWVQAQFLYVIVAAYAVVQMIFDIFLNKIDLRVFRSASIILLTGYIVSLPVIIAGRGSLPIDITFFLSFGVTAFGILYYFFGAKKIPWTISLPTIFGMGVAALGVIYAVFVGIIQINFLKSLTALGQIIFGSGVYGNKVSMTIAEANTYQISNTVMSFGPAIYWVGWAGLLMLFYFYYKNKMRRDYLFIIVLFIIDLWLTGTAGRFINDMVPLIAILSGGIIWYVISKLNYKQMLRNIQSAGGGFHGIKKGVSLLQVFAIFFIAFIVILPNVFLVMDAAVPHKPYQKDDGNWSNLKWDIFGEDHSSAFGLSVGKEYYWVDAFSWLAKQDTDIKLAKDRPAFISWWDYGFYEVAVGDHPTVADNFQDGIPPAGNFHTATSEEEAVVVWITRLIEGHITNNNYKLSDEVRDVLEKHLGSDVTNEISSWIKNGDFEGSPSYGKYINEEYNEYFKEDINPKHLTVGAQWDENAFYHDMVNLLIDDNNTALTDEEITNLYHDIQEATGYSIRYYGVEGYDKQIFNIFAFLSDKSLILLGAPEDEFIKITYNSVDIRNQQTGSGYLSKYLNMSESQKRYIRITETGQEYKDEYFNTMFYKTYIGPVKTNEQGQKDVWSDLQYPCLNMRHFYPEFISNLSDPMLRYQNTGRASVVIAKYYEGAIINGVVLFNDKPIEKDVTAAIRKNLQYAPDLVVPIDHDKQNIVGTENDENATGEFNLIAGAGANLAILRNLELSNSRVGAFVVKEINFTGINGSELAPITDDAAMRKDNSNYIRNITINVDPAYCTGHIFNDTNKDDKYNNSIDEAIDDANIYFYEINEFDQQAMQEGNLLPVQDKTKLVEQATTNETGYYNISGVIPGWYVINVYQNDFLISQEIVPLYSGNQSYNASMPEKSDIEGSLFYDSDFDDTFNPSFDETIDNTKVELIYQVNQFNQKVVENITTDSNGRYSFEDIIPGQYIIKAETDRYQIEEQVTINENETKIYNVSMDLIPVELSGSAVYDDNAIDGVDITFAPDESVENNTAAEQTTTTDENGTYSIALQPGNYNITLTKTVNQGEEIPVYVSINNSLDLNIGQEPTEKDFTLEKKTVSMYGTITSGGETQENVQVLIDAVNNSLGIPSSVVRSDQNGTYKVELIPMIEGTDIDQISYNVSARVNITNSSSEDYTHIWDGMITVTENQISTGYNKNIDLARDEE